MTVLGQKSDPFQQSTSQQFSAAKGAGGRGEAFKCAAAGPSPAFNGVPDQS